MQSEIYKSQLKQSRLNEARDFPNVILIDTTSYCNLKCSMCFHREMKRKKGNMPWKLFTKIIDEIAETDKNVRIWMVFFGEPLIIKKNKPSIFEMIAYAKNKGLEDVVVNSNACLMDDYESRELIKSGLDAIYIGIDAFTAKTYGKLRVGGNYPETVYNVLHLLKLQKKMNVITPKVFVQFVEMDVNMREKEPFINFWQKAGAIVKVRPKVSWAGKVDAPNLVLTDKDRWPCHWAMQTMSITDTGKVVACAVDLDAKFVAGDITEQTLKEVWNGKLKDFRQLHLNRQFDKLPDICRYCKDWQAAKSEYIEE